MSGRLSNLWEFNIIESSRNLQKLKGEVSNDEFSLLASITSAGTPEAIKHWETFCRQSPSKRVKGVVAQPQQLGNALMPTRLV